MPNIGNATPDGQYIIDTTPPGQSLNSAFVDVNLNFDQVWATGLVNSNIQIANNTIYTTNTNGNLILNPNGIGAVVANAHVVPDSNRVRNLGSASLYWDSLYVWYGNIQSASIATANIGNANIANIDTLTISVSGNITGNYFIGNGSQLTDIVTWVTAPLTNTSPGTAGQAAYNVGGNLYICVSANTWSKFTGTTSW